MKLSKIVSVLVIICIFLPIISNIPYAFASSLDVIIDPETNDPNDHIVKLVGDELTLSIRVEDVVDLIDIEIYVLWDSNYLDYSSHNLQIGKEFHDGLFYEEDDVYVEFDVIHYHSNIDLAEYRVMVGVHSGLDFFTGSGTILQMTFNVKDPEFDFSELYIDTSVDEYNGGQPEHHVFLDSVYFSVIHPDITITPSIWTNPMEPIVGETVEITTYLNFRGYYELDDVEILFLVDGIIVDSDVLDFTFDTITHSSAEWTTSYTFPESGRYELEIEVSAPSSVEDPPFNNRVTQDVIVGLEEPILTMDVSPDSITLDIGDTVLFEGSVYDQFGEGVSDVLVYIEDPITQFSTSTTTDFNGEFTYSVEAIEKGEYIFTFSTDTLTEECEVEVEGRKALLIDCYPTFLIPETHVREIVRDYLEEMDFEVKDLIGEEVTVEELIDELDSGYDLVWWRAHASNGLIQTGERIPEDILPGQSHWSEKVNYYIEEWEEYIPTEFDTNPGAWVELLIQDFRPELLHGRYVSITPEFISTFFDANTMDGSLVYLHACLALSQNNFWMGFQNIGADVVLGYTESTFYVETDLEAVVTFSLFSEGYSVDEICNGLIDMGEGVFAQLDLTYRPTIRGDYRLVEEVPSAVLSVILHSPANLFITDSQGRSIGVNPITGDLVTEIPEAFYYGPDTEPQIVMIPNPLDEDYLIQLIGTGTGDFTVDFRFITPDGTIMRTLSGEIAEGVIYQYEIQFDGESLEAVPDPISDLTQLKSYINDLDDNLFNPKFKNPNQLKKAFSKKVDEVILKIQSRTFDEALDKLSKDIRAKVDGNTKPVDWITSFTEQERICIIIDYILSSIETLF